jgi:hypothetical protein
MQFSKILSIFSLAAATSAIRGSSTPFLFLHNHANN